MPHPEFAQPVAITPPEASQNVNVALLGSLNRGKGSQVLENLVEDAEARSLPIRYHVIGKTDNDRILSKSSRVAITGPYALVELATLVAESFSRIALFLSLTPETFSYTLSEAWNLGLHPVAFDFGAIAGRMREGKIGTLIPLCKINQPSFINDLLLTLTPVVPKPWTPIKYEHFVRDYYDLPLR
jgi:hypothetical protein